MRSGMPADAAAAVPAISSHGKKEIVSMNKVSLRALALALLLSCTLLLTGCSSAVNDTITAIDGIATAENKTTALREAEALYEKLS